MSEDLVTEIERYKRRQDAAYGAAFALQMVNTMLGNPLGSPRYTERQVAVANAVALIVASEVPAPPPPSNERALHRRGCICHLCNPSHITWECPNCHKLSPDNGALGTPPCPHCGQTEGT
jgi:hypothetical protein